MFRFLKSFLLVGCVFLSLQTSKTLFASASQDALIEACKNADRDGCRYAIQNGARLDLRDNAGLRALEVGVIVGDLEFVEFVCDWRPPFLSTMEEPSTISKKRAKSGHRPVKKVEVLKTLSPEKALPKLKTSSFKTLVMQPIGVGNFLHLAIIQGDNTKMLDVILNAVPESSRQDYMNEENSGGFTPLSLALDRHRERSVIFLVMRTDSSHLKCLPGSLLWKIQQIERLQRELNRLVFDPSEGEAFKQAESILSRSPYVCIESSPKVERKRKKVSAPLPELADQELEIPQIHIPEATIDPSAEAAPLIRRRRSDSPRVRDGRRRRDSVVNFFPRSAS